MFGCNITYNLFGYSSNAIIHISIDDTFQIFKDLTEHSNEYESIWDNYTLGFLQKMHNSYGACFSLYCFCVDENFSLEKCTTKYVGQFEECCDWLKFNFHAYRSLEELNDISVSLAKEEVAYFYTYMKKIVGAKSFDAFCRLEYFHGNEAILNTLYEFGVEGLYTADDERMSYSLNVQQNKLVKNEGEYKLGKLIMRRTDLRLDGVSYPFYDTINLIKNDTKYIEIFTHEWLLEDGQSNSVYKIRDVCKAAFYYNADMGYY